MTIGGGDGLRSTLPLVNRDWFDNQSVDVVTDVPLLISAITASPVTVDLAPYLDAVPAVIVDRLRGARRVLAVSHENPDADTLGATLAVPSASSA